MECRVKWPAEFLGTFILIVFGVGVVAQVTFSGGSQSGPGDQYRVGARGDGRRVRGGRRLRRAPQSGGDAVALAVRRGFPWSKVPPYMVAQVAGAFVASAVVYCTYARRLNAFRRRRAQVTGARARPASSRPIRSRSCQHFRRVHRSGRRHGAADGGYLRHHRSAERRAPAGLAPVARRAARRADRRDVRLQRRLRDQSGARFGPRLFTAVAGWGGGVFTAGGGWWWVPIVAPIIGGVAGRLSRTTCCVGKHFPHRPQAEAGAMSRFILALDQGTTSSRAIVFRPRRRRRVGRAAGVPADLPVARPRRARSRGDLGVAGSRGARGARCAPASRPTTSRPSASPTSARRRSLWDKRDGQAGRQRDRLAKPHHRADLRAS